LNTVLAVVHLVPGDRIRQPPKEVKDAKAGGEVVDVKAEPEQDVKMEGAGEGGEDPAGHSSEVRGEGEGADEEGEGGNGEDEDEDEVPYVEEIGWREVTGFIVM
jgi:polyribonucleotide 5'-hydroxyl-kinase